MIRKANNGDTKRVMELLHQVNMVHHRLRPDLFRPHATKYSEEELHAIFSDSKTPVFVFDEDGTVQGYAFCQLSEVRDDQLLHDQKTLYVDDICVDESARGHQVGTALFDHVRHYAASAGCTHITLNVWEGNTPALSFYRKQGMQVRKTTMEISLASEKYSHTYTSTASDITPLYRLTPNAMLMYFQDCFARMMTIHGVAAFDIVKQHRMWVITEVQLNVHPTVTFWSEEFTVETWVSELTALRLYCDFRIVRKDNGQLIASGTSQWNILNLETKRLETTDFLAERLCVVPELTTGSHKKVRLPKMQTADMEMEHQATRLDLDFNFHVSNRSYVSMALLTMPSEVLASQTVASLTVHWLHETYLDERLVCRTARTGDDTYLHTVTGADGVVACELMSTWQPQPATPDVSEVLDRR